MKNIKNISLAFFILIITITTAVYAYTPANGEYGYAAKISSCIVLSESTIAKRAMCAAYINQTISGSYRVTPSSVVDIMDGDAVIFNAQPNGTYFSEGSFIGGDYKSSLNFTSSSSATELSTISIYDGDSEPDILLTTSISYWRK